MGTSGTQSVSNIIRMKTSPRYRFVQEVCRKERKYARDEEVREYVLIMVEQDVDGRRRRIVHPISDYLLQSRISGGRLKVNSLKTKASYIVRFLNYVLIEKSSVFEVADVMDLKFEHGVEFLNYYASTGVKKSTVESCENELKQFYYFLAQKDVLKYISVSDFDKRMNEHTLYESIVSPFYGVDYPDENESDILHYLPQELLMIFIDTASVYAPRVALGIYFQFFGGLRVGEVVNISRHTIRLKGPHGKYGIVVHLKDRRFRQDLKHHSSGGAVKKARKQAVYPYKGGILEKLYKFHTENFKATDGTTALFVNDDGKAMTDYSYRYYFNRVKERFIQRFKDADDVRLKNYAVYLSSKKWSTHLGRGVFSNMIAEIATNITQIRLARGDNTFDASMSYLSDTDKMAKELYDNQIDMWEMLQSDVANHLHEEV